MTGPNNSIMSNLKSRLISGIMLPAIVFLIAIIAIATHSTPSLPYGDLTTPPPLPSIEELQSLSKADEGIKAYEEGRFLDAAIFFEKLDAAHPNNAKIKMALGLCYYRLEKFGPAESAFRMAISRNPALPEPYLGLANIMIHHDKIGEAIRFLEKYIKLIGPEEQALTALAALYHDKGDYTAADRILSLLPNSPNKPQTMLKYALSLAQKGENARAAIILEKLKSQFPNSYDIYYALGVVYYQQNKYARAVPHFDKAFKIKPPGNNPEMIMNYAAVLALAGHYSRAVPLFEQVARLAPDTPKLDYYIGVCAYKAGNYKKAETAMKRAVDSGDTNTDLLTALASLFAQKGDYESAEFYIEKLLAKYPDSFEIGETYAKILINNNKFDAAEKQIAKLISKRTSNADLYYMHAITLAKLERNNDAIAELEKTIKINPKHAEAYSTLATLYENRYDSDKSIEYYKKTIELSPNDLDTRRRYATMLKRKSMNSEALAQYLSIITRDRKDFDSWRDAGALHKTLSSKQTTIDYFRKMAEAFPTDGYGLAMIGYIHETDGDTAAARNLFESAVTRKNNTDLGVYATLAKYYEDNGNTPRAEALYNTGLDALLAHSQKVYSEFMEQLHGGGQLDFNTLVMMSQREENLNKYLDQAVAGLVGIFTARDDIPGLSILFYDFLDKYPGNRKVLEQLVKIEKEHNQDTDKVIKLSQLLLLANPSDVEGHIALAWAYVQQSNFPAAGLEYMRAVELNPSSREAVDGLFDTYEKQNRLETLIPFIQLKRKSKKSSEALNEIYDKIIATTGAAPVFEEPLPEIIPAEVK